MSEVLEDAFKTKILGPKATGLGFPRPALCYKPSLTGNFPRKCQQDCFERLHLRSRCQKRTRVRW